MRRKWSWWGWDFIYSAGSWWVGGGNRSSSNGPISNRCPQGSAKRKYSWLKLEVLYAGHIKKQQNFRLRVAWVDDDDGVLFLSSNCVYVCAEESWTVWSLADGRNMIHSGDWCSRFRACVIGSGHGEVVWIIYGGVLINFCNLCFFRKPRK